MMRIPQTERVSNEKNATEMRTFEQDLKAAVGISGKRNEETGPAKWDSPRTVRGTD